MKEEPRDIQGLVELIERANKGSSQDLEELFERFGPLIKKLVKEFSIQLQEDARYELMNEFVQAVHRFKTRSDRGIEELEHHYPQNE